MVFLVLDLRPQYQKVGFQMLGLEQLARPTTPRKELQINGLDGCFLEGGAGGEV